MAASSLLTLSLSLGVAGYLIGASFAVANTGSDVDEWAAAMKAPEQTDSRLGNYLAGRQAVNDRDRINAAKFFARALKGDPDNRMLLEQTFAYSISAGWIDDARALADRIVKVAPKNIGANIMLSLDAFNRGDYVAARLPFTNADNGPIARLATGVLKAWTYVAAGDFRAAFQTLDTAGANPAFDSLKVYHLALMKDLSGNVADAAKAYEEAIVKGGRTLRTVDAYGRFFERLGKPEKAIAAYDDFIAALPNHPVIVEGRKRALLGEKPERLIRTAKDGMAETLYTLGASLTQDGGGDLALIYLNFALYMRPDFPVAQYLMADILERQRRLEAAVEVYSKINPQAPLKRQAEIRAALALDTLDRTDEAKTRMDALIKADPGDASALSSLGDILRFRKRYAEASDYYSRAIAAGEDDPAESWRLYYSRGMTYERQKKWEKAEPDFLKALELSKDQPLVLNYLGYTWIDMGVNLEKGLVMIRKAVDQRPHDGYIVDSLGWAYYKLGRFEEAVVELERAVELQAADPVINDHLGDAYWRVGRRTEARFQWSHALEMEPEAEEIPKIKAKLKDGLPDAGPVTETGLVTEPAASGKPGKT
ncbi:TPR domain protein [hydrothermal vent metagenome]|uniref:TPR domain protein n=1 Tax=hydrothermal vent metagenome TaxID=652676 RepID=A0A3B0T9G3_9ZZZZ